MTEEPESPTIVTLPSGEQVTEYPDGHQVLIPGESAVTKWFDEAEDTHQWLNAEKQYYDQVEVQKKLERQAEGDALPSEKSPL